MLSTKKEGAIDKDHTYYIKRKKTQKAIYCMIPLMKVLEKTELEMEEKNQQLRGTGGRVGNKEPAGGVLRALGC